MAMEDDQKWDDLPQENLISIFLRLGFEDKYRNVALVCKAWRVAVTDPACWIEVDMEPCFESRRESAHWWSTEFENCMDSMIKSVADWGSSQLLRLRARHCSHVSLSHLATRCPHLQILHVPMSQSVTDETLAEVAEKCTALESVDLSECRNVSGAAMESLGRHCTRLSVLKRSMLDLEGNCRARSLMPLRYLQMVPNGDQEGERIAKCLPQLKHLEMCHSTVGDRGLMALVAGCGNLEFLDLRGCGHLTGRGIEEAERKMSDSIHFKKPVIPDRNFQLERYGHWQLYDNRFSHQHLQL